jgi:hypothetical protein
MRIPRLCVVLAAGAVILSAAEPDYFPLAVGNRWEYGHYVAQGRRILEITGTATINGEQWFRIVWTTHDPSVKSPYSPKLEELIRVDSERLLRMDRDGTRSGVWVDFSAARGALYPVQGLCSESAVNYPRERHIIVTFEGTCSDFGTMSQTFVSSVGLTDSTEQSYVGLKRWKIVTWRIVKAHINGRDRKF